MRRKTPLVTGQTSHVFSKSINHFTIYNGPGEYMHFLMSLRHYQHEDPPVSLSKLVRDAKKTGLSFEQACTNCVGRRRLRARIIAYCLMPTHFHLILQQVLAGGITSFVRDVCCSYSHYFNLRHDRKGPLWQNRFVNETIWNERELLHCSMYVHLNPTTKYLVDDPAAWPWSSYPEFVGKPVELGICDTAPILNAMPLNRYHAYVAGNIEEQRRLKRLRMDRKQTPGLFPVSD